MPTQFLPDAGIARLSPKHVGELIREARSRHRLSQMELALDIGISPRHMSFIETGRSVPSAEVLLAIAQRLDVPLRQRNRWLVAADYAPRFHSLTHDAVPLAPVRRALSRLLAAHDPYPGLVIDRLWNVTDANSMARRFLASLPAELTKPPVNLLRAGLHPEGLSTVTTNFEQWGAYLVQQLANIDRHQDDEAAHLVDEVLAYPTVAWLEAQADDARGPAAGPADDLGSLLIPCKIRHGDTVLSMFSVLSALETPREVTLQELRVELFFPADAATEQALRMIAPA